jgi:hypothetical protein
VKIFSLEDSSEKRILIGNNIIGCMDEKTSVDSIKIPNAQTTIVLLLANVVPRPEGNRRGGVILLNPHPQESSDDRIDFFHKSLGKEDNGHVEDRNGGKNNLI